MAMQHFRDTRPALWADRAGAAMSAAGRNKSGTTGARHGTQRRSSTNVAGQMVGSRRRNGRRALRAPGRSWRCSCLRGRNTNAALSKKAAPNMRGSCCRTLALLFVRPLLREPTRNVRCPKSKAWQARGVHQKFLECSGLREVHLGARLMANAVPGRQYSFACGKRCCSSSGRNKYPAGRRANKSSEWTTIHELIAILCVF